MREPRNCSHGIGDVWSRLVRNPHQALHFLAEIHAHRRFLITHVPEVQREAGIGLVLVTPKRSTAFRMNWVCSAAIWMSSTWTTSIATTKSFNISRKTDYLTQHFPHPEESLKKISVSNSAYTKASSTSRCLKSQSSLHVNDAMSLLDVVEAVGAKVSKVINSFSLAKASSYQPRLSSFNHSVCIALALQEPL